MGSPEIDGASMITNDDPTVAALQQSILDGLRAGAGFHTGHHEGGTDIVFRDGGYWHEDFGEYPGSTRYADEDELLRRVREFYDWEANRDCAPGKAPEVAVWKFILTKLRK